MYKPKRRTRERSTKEIKKGLVSPLKKERLEEEDNDSADLFEDQPRMRTPMSKKRELTDKINSAKLESRRSGSRERSSRVNKPILNRAKGKRDSSPSDSSSDERKGKKHNAKLKTLVRKSST